MKRLLGGMMFVVGMSVLISSALAQDGSATVRFRDRSGKQEKVATSSGKIKKESLSGVTINTGTGDREIVPADIVDIDYSQALPPNVRLDQYGPANKAMLTADTQTDRTKKFDSYKTAIGEFDKLIAKVPASASAAARHYQFVQANLKAALTDVAPEEQLVAASKDARDALGKAIKEHADSWQRPNAVKSLARLLIDSAAPDYDGAVKLFDELAKTSGVAKETKQEMELLAIDTLLRAKKAAEAKSRVDALLASVPSTDPLNARLKVVQIGCDGDPAKAGDAIKKLEAIVNDAKSDNNLKAVAYNTLGDLYQATGKKNDAMWAYLWVDVVYFQDKAEHLKALERLVKVFEERGETDKRNQFKEKLLASRR
jgi:hypothetical protein